MWQGDELQNMYQVVTPLKTLMGPVILYGWIWLSANLIHNAFLAIVAQGYLDQKKSGMFSWLKNDLDDPDEELSRELLDSDEDVPETQCEEFLSKVRKRQLLRTEALYDNDNY